MNFLSRILLTLLLPLAAVPAMAGGAESLPDLRGVVVYADGWGYKPKTGLYSLPKGDGVSPELIYEGPNGPSVAVGNRLYTINRVMLPELEIDYPRYTVYDLASGQELFFKNCNWPLDWSLMPADMDVDPTTGQVYGITYTPEMTGYQLSKFTFTDTDVYSEEVAPLPGNWNAMAFDASGQLYAISKRNAQVDGELVCVSSQLNKIDKATGAVTPVGETGMAPEYISSATIDPASGRMFWTVSPYDGRGLLTEVDLTTGKAEILHTYPRSEEIVGLFVATREAEQAAPARPENLAISFDGGSLSGSLSFDIPALLYDGSVAAGSVAYSVKASGSLLAEGTGECGSHVSCPVALPAAGSYEFAVVLTNSAGESPEARLTAFIGNGTPGETYVRLRTDGNTMLLSWMAVDYSTDGGFIDPALVTYDIVRYPGAVKVAEGIAAVSFSEMLPEPAGFTTYHYGVTAVFASNRSVESLSNKEALGAVVPPYAESFDSEDSLAGWKLIDANSDRRMWMWSTWQNLRISGNAQNAMDDWIITPKISLEGGKTYEVAFEMSCDSPEYAEKAEIMVGGAPTPAAMVLRIAEPFEITSPNNDPKTVTARFTPAASGLFHIGIHGISDADSYMLNFDNFRIKETGGASVGEISGSAASVIAGRGSLTVSGTPAATVLNAEGRTVAIAKDGVAVSLPAGLYLVSLPQGTVKVIVK